MKTFASLFIFLFCAVSLSIAQPTSGTIFVGGDLGLSFSTDKTKNDNTTTTNYKTVSFSAVPRAGYFLSDVMAVGIAMGFLGSVTNYDDNAFIDKRSSSNLIFNPFARYYIINQKGGIFAEGNMSISIGNTKTTNNNNIDEDTSTNFFLGVRPGVYYYISSRIVLQAYYGWFGLQSQRVKTGEDTKEINNDFGLDFNSNSLSFGFAYEF